MQWKKWIAHGDFGASARALSMVFASAALAQVPAEAKSGEIPPSSQPGLSLRVYTNLVLIPVTVTDARNRFVLGLQKEDFRVLHALFGSTARPTDTSVYTSGRTSR